MATVEELYSAAQGGRVPEVMVLLRDHPGLNVNWANNQSQDTSLHRASCDGHAEVVKLLLAHPAISVNPKTNNGQTPFSLACLNGHVSVVSVLLQDPRVNIVLEDNSGRTPLWKAAYFGHHEVVEWLIASARNLGDFQNNMKGKHFDGKEYTALGIARREKKAEVVSVLERFMANPAQTRQQLRQKLNITGPVLFHSIWLTSLLSYSSLSFFLFFFLLDYFNFLISFSCPVVNRISA